MISRIIWLEEAEVEIAKIWFAAAKEVRTNMTQQIYNFRDAVLDDPESVGKSRSGNRRIAFFRPLTFSFEVDWDRSIVWVQSVQYAGGEPDDVA